MVITHSRAAERARARLPTRAHASCRVTVSSLSVVRTKVFAYTSGLSLASGSAAAGIIAMTNKAAAPTLADSQQRQVDDINLATHNNLAMAYSKIDNHEKAIHFASKVSRPCIRTAPPSSSCRMTSSPCDCSRRLLLTRS